MSLTLLEARKFYTVEEMSDEALMQLVSEVDCLQEKVLDEIFGRAVMET